MFLIQVRANHATITHACLNSLAVATPMDGVAALRPKCTRERAHMLMHTCVQHCMAVVAAVVAAVIATVVAIAAVAAPEPAAQQQQQLQ